MKNSYVAKFIALLCVAVLTVSLAGCNAHKKKRDRKKEQAKLYYELGRNHFGRSDYLAALRELRKSVEIISDDPEVQHLLGTTYFMLKHYLEAETHLKIAVKLNQEYPDAYNNLGNVYLAMGRWDEAITQFEKCFDFILYQPNFPQVYTNIGMAYARKGDPDKAEEAFRIAIKLNHKFCPAYLNLADLLSKAGQKNEAIMEYEKVIQICPNSQLSLMAHLYMGIELNSIGKKDEACRHFFMVVKKAPESEAAAKAGQYMRLLRCR